MTGDRRTGALLMTYGSPDSLDEADVAAYLQRVRGGREPDRELIVEFTRRYRVIGGSPLIEITRAQALALEDVLGGPVEVGMRFSEPSIQTGLARLAERRATDVAAIILSPQYSDLLMGGYSRAIGAAREALGAEAPAVTVAGAWHDVPAFTEAVANGIRSTVARVAADEGGPTSVLLTAHSLPRTVADREPDYLAQLRDTATAIASQAGLADGAWHACWQSAGHEPGVWMQPDFADLMPDLAAAGTRTVVVAPIQFLADHLETLYDIDVGAREQAERHGLAFRRVPSLGTHPLLMEALAVVARRTVAGLVEA